jgi:hypothetical protein
MNTETLGAMRPDAAAAILSISTQRLARMRLEGGGPPYVKIGRSILYRREDLEAWLAAHIRHSTSEIAGLAP